MSLVCKTFQSSSEGIAFECCAVVDPDTLQIYCKFKELAHFLGYHADPYRASALVKKEWKRTWYELSSRMGVTRQTFPDSTLFISEAGIYSLLFRSRKLAAKRLTDYVLEVVIPALRQDSQRFVEGLRGALTEKLEELDVTREKLKLTQKQLEEKEELLSETRLALEEVNEMLRKIRKECDLKEKEATSMLAETRNALLEKDKLLESEMQQKRRLQDDMRIIRQRVAVAPKSRSVRHALCVFQHGNVYKVVRVQKRGLKKSIKRIPREFTLVHSNLDVPNPFHVMNRLKETLPKHAFRYNTITTELDLVSLIKQCTGVTD